MKQLGKWSKNKGSIITMIGKHKVKYIGDLEEPFPPQAVEKDISSELHIPIKLIPTSPRGGVIITS